MGIDRKLAEKIIEEGNGILRLKPAWVARKHIPAGRRFELEEEEYDLLVISTIPEVPAELKDLYKKLGLDEQDQTPSSWESTYPLLIETSVPNVFLTALS